MPGVFVPRGAQLQFPAGSITIRIDEGGEVIADPVTPHLRVDMWPHWLQEAIEAAVASSGVHDQLALELASATSDERLGDLLDLELRTSMRAITSAAFAIDAFYASVRARSPEHPDRRRWSARAGRAPRHVQVFATLHYALKIRRPGAGQMKRSIKELFTYRGWAVHADSAFKQAVHREDVDRGVDWHYAAFRSENAINSVHVTAQMLDVLVELFVRGSDQLREWGPVARTRLDQILDLYDAQSCLIPLVRAAETRAQRWAAPDGSPG